MIERLKNRDELGSGMGECEGVLEASISRCV